MRVFLQPLSFYRKYSLANKILKWCCSTHFSSGSLNNEEKLTTGRSYIELNLASLFSNESSLDTLRLMQAVDILEENKQVRVVPNEDIYQFKIQCTRKGEVDLSKGFYYKKIAGVVVRIIGTSSLIVVSTFLLSPHK